MEFIGYLLNFSLGLHYQTSGTLLWVLWLTMPWGQSCLLSHLKDVSGASPVPYSSLTLLVAN